MIGRPRPGVARADEMIQGDPHGVPAAPVVAGAQPWHDAWRVQQVGIRSEYDSAEAAQQLIMALVICALMGIILAIWVISQALVAALNESR